MKLWLTLTLLSCATVGWWDYSCGDYLLFGMMCLCVGINLRGLMQEFRN